MILRKSLIKIKIDEPKHIFEMKCMNIRDCRDSESMLRDKNKSKNFLIFYCAFDVFYTSFVKFSVIIRNLMIGIKY